MHIGLIVDSATDVIDLDPEIIEEPPYLDGLDSSLINGVAKLENGLLILLNILRVFNVDEVTKLEGVSEAEVEEGDNRWQQF